MTDRHYKGNLLVNYVFLNPNLAVLLHSADAAIVLQQLHLMSHDKHEDTYYNGGRNWVREPIRTLSVMMPWLSEDRIKRILKRLESEHYIDVCVCANEFSNKDKWYTVNMDRVVDDG